MKLKLDAPYNSLSFGQITYGITKELFARNTDLLIYPKMGQVDLAAFDTISEPFKHKFQYATQNGFKQFDPNIPSLQIWHINGAQYKLSRRNFLLTFHETSQITEEEKNILNSFDKIFVTSTYSKNIMENYGVTVPIIYTPMGTDVEQYHKLNKKYYDDPITCWGIIGKAENRKKTKQAIQGWCSQFAGNPAHRLHLFVQNPFLTDKMNAIYADIFEGKPQPPNVIINGFQQQNSLINDAINSFDIIIDMSGAEALSLPSLIAVSLGKHAVVHNCTAMKDWANAENSVLVESSGMEPVYDGIFFQPGQPFSQGNIYTWDQKDYAAALQTALSRVKANKVNEAGKLLADKYSFKNGVDIILKEING